MANKPGKKETAERSKIAVQKRTPITVPGSSSTKKHTPKVELKKAPSKPTKTTKTSAVETVVPAVARKRRQAKIKLIESIYQDHVFPSDTVVTEKELAKRVRKSAACQPIEEKSEEVLSKDTAVTLPKAVNERLLSKKRALSTWYDQVFPRSAGRVLFIVGLLFLFSGSLGLVPFVKSAYPTWSNFADSIVCEVSHCDPEVPPQSAQAIGGVTELIPPPAVTFLIGPPESVHGTSTVVVRAEYVAELKVYAESQVTGVQTQLPFQGSPAGTDYTALISPEILTSGNYRLRVEARAARDQAKVLFSGANFEVKGSTLPETRVAEEVEPVPESQDEAETSTSSPESTSTTTEAEVVTKKPEEKPLVGIRVPRDGEDFAYKQSGSALIVTISAVKARTVEVYAERVNATMPLFLGLGKRVGDDGGWQLQYDTSTLPKGRYSLFARIVSGPSTDETKRLLLSVSGAHVYDEATTTAAALATESALQELRTENDSGFPSRSNYLATLLAASDFDKDITNALQENEATVNALLTRYASVFQSNNEPLLALAKDVMAKEIETMVSKQATNPGNELTVSEWRKGLSSAFLAMQADLSEYERKLVERSGRSLITDSDGDGISDFDELTLYETNPLRPDSDSDGVTDGIEIVSSYDPEDSRDEAVLAYSSPREWGTVSPDSLAVTGVSPIIETDNARGVPSVMTEITGRAPANSLVNVFVFSTPIVAVVRADSEGAFAYQLEKPLEDGEHEVYVGLLDNAGTVVAKSEPYRFSKSKEFFTELCEGNEATVVTTAKWVPGFTDLLNVIVALGVIIFGLLLIIVANRLRKPAVLAAEASTETPDEVLSPKVSES